MWGPTSTQAHARARPTSRSLSCCPTPVTTHTLRLGTAIHRRWWRRAKQGAADTVAPAWSGVVLVAVGAGAASPTSPRNQRAVPEEEAVHRERVETGEEKEEAEAKAAASDNGPSPAVACDDAPAGAATAPASQRAATARQRRAEEDMRA